MTSMGQKRDKFTALAAKNTNPDQREMHETLRLPRKTYLFGSAANGSGRYDEICEESSTPRLPTTNGTPTQGPMLTNSWPKQNFASSCFITTYHCGILAEAKLFLQPSDAPVPRNHSKEPCANWPIHKLFHWCSLVIQNFINFKEHQMHSCIIFTIRFYSTAWNPASTHTLDTTGAVSSPLVLAKAKHPASSVGKK